MPADVVYEQEFDGGKVRIKLAGWLADPEKAVKKPILETLARFSRELTDEVRQVAPKQTGNLAKSFQVTDVLTYGPSRYAIRFYFDSDIAPYWRYVLYGRDPEEGSRILPLTADALSFSRWENAPIEPNAAGKFVFKSVRMVPIKPNRFLQDTFKRAAARVTGLTAENFVVFLSR